MKKRASQCCSCLAPNRSGSARALRLAEREGATGAALERRKAIERARAAVRCRGMFALEHGVGRYGGEQQDLAVLHHDASALVLEHGGRDAVVFEQALKRADDRADDPAVARIQAIDGAAVRRSDAAHVHGPS